MPNYQQVKCVFCNQFFQKQSYEIRRSKKHYCSMGCIKKAQASKSVEVTCLCCEKRFQKKSSQLKKSPNSFCSRSCSVAYLNKLKPKRKLSKQCKGCKATISSQRTYCRECISKGKHRKIVDISLPIKYFFLSKNSNRYTKIRNHAKSITQSWCRKCENCGYSKHVETCHKIPINEFDNDTPIGIVNDHSNLLLLCPNCHWELDHALLTPPPQS